VWFCHNGFGVVINRNCKILGGVIQHSVTIGEVDDGGKSPMIHKGVFIGARAVLLGDITIGENTKIGAGAVVLKDVPANCLAVGIPARTIKKE
jgi:serine O-acetyltransferase